MLDILLRILAFVALIVGVLVTVGILFRSAGLIRLPAGKRSVKESPPPHLPRYLAFLESRKFWKAVVFAFVTLIGYPLIAGSFAGLAVSLKTENDTFPVLLIHAYAWMAYIVMGVFWIAEKPLGKFLPVTGSIAGGLSVLLVAPLFIVLIWLLPMIVLAVKMAVFHSSGDGALSDRG